MRESGLYKSGYGVLEKFLHHIALGNRFLAEASFDLEQASRLFNTAEIVKGQHVFIAGLARAGTTILMRRFHATGIFRSLTYRDMPFVLMPNLWRNITRLSRKHIEKKERAHGDRIMVDFDSPEALEEVFWRVFASNHYIKSDTLVPMTVDKEILEKFQRYVAAILASNSNNAQERYLSKNNNNILRLPCIKKAFPNAIIIIPFRDPLQQAFSLMRQHARFTKSNQTDTFVRSYMTWLAHHEFGPDHRPFRFSNDPVPFRTDTLDYWLKIWHDTYSWLINNTSYEDYFLSYETLCRETDKVWGWLKTRANINASISEHHEPLEIKNQEVNADVDKDLLENCNHLYERLGSSSMTLSV